MKRALVKVLFAVLVVAAEIFIETMKKSKKACKWTTQRLPQGGRGLNTAAAMQGAVP